MPLELGTGTKIDEITHAKASCLKFIQKLRLVFCASARTAFISTIIVE